MFQVKASLSFWPSISMSRRMGTRTSAWVAFSWITAGSWSSKLDPQPWEKDVTHGRGWNSQYSLPKTKKRSIVSRLVSFVFRLVFTEVQYQRGKVLFLSRPSRLRLMVVEQGTASRWWELLGRVGTHWLFLLPFCSLKHTYSVGRGPY